MTPFSKNNVLKKNSTLSLLVSFIISTAILYAPSTTAAPIYKVIDEQTGQVTFTDRPQDYEQQMGKQISQTGITTDTNSSSGNASTAPNQTTSTAPALTQPSTATKAARVNYQLTMTEPSKERAYHRPAQSIVVNVQLQPALQAGDSMSIYLDGNEVAQGLSASIATVDMLPGAHVVKVVVNSETGQALKQVERTVYVIQNTQTLQKNKKIAQQLLAYQRLP